jgi:hypothetical protein
MCGLPENFSPFPPHVLDVLQELDDDWRLTLPANVVDPIQWLTQYDRGTTLPMYPETGGALCLVGVITATTLDMRKVYVMTVLIPTPVLYQRLLYKLLTVYEVGRLRNFATLPLLGVFFTVPCSIIAARDPELFD